MAIYAISDLHLSFKQPKPMDIFGDNWKDHAERTKANWMQKVKEQDTVLLPGDFSWAMKLEDTLPDFQFLNALPGRKLLLKGNHDYWWTTLNKMRNFLKENNIATVDFIYNNSYCVEDTIICGTRFWSLNDTKDGKKMLEREINRLKLSLEYGIQQFGTQKRIMVCMHYPPISKAAMADTEMMQKILAVLQEYSVSICIYGHLHGDSHKEAVEGVKNGILFKLVSGDYINFDPICLS